MFFHCIVSKHSMFLLLAILLFWHHSEGMPFVCLLLKYLLMFKKSAMGGHHMLRGGNVVTVESANARVGTSLFWNVSNVSLGHLWDPSPRGTTVVACFLRGHGLNLQYAYCLSFEKH